MTCISGHNSRQDNEHLLILLVSLATLVAFLLSFVFRSFDDNRLTSWRWVFADGYPGTILPILVAGVLLAYVLSRTSFPERWSAPLLFVSSFLVAGLFRVEPEVIIDASRYFVQAKHLELYGVGYFLAEWGKDIAAWTDLPLIPFLYGLVMTLFGEVRIGVQAFTALLISATVVLTYLIGRALWDEPLGRRAGMLLLGMPYLLTQIPLMLVDVPTMFFLTLAVYATIEATKRGGVALLALAAASIVLAALSKYSAWVMLSVLPVIFLSHLEHGSRAVHRRAAVIALGAFILAVPFIVLKFDVVAAQIEFLYSYQLPGLERWGESHTSTFFFQIHPFITIAALGSVFVAVKKRDLKYVIVGWMLLVVIALGVRRIRYVLITFPMLALMAAYGLNAIKNTRISAFIVGCAVASALITAVFGFLPFLRQTSAVNLMRAGEYLDTIDEERVEVFTLEQPRSMVNPAAAVPILDLFTRKKILYRDDARAMPSRRSIATSPLRFTWEYDNPPYFRPPSDGAADDAAVAVILNDGARSLPDPIMKRIADLRLSKEFAVSDKVFRYKTIVKIYQPRFSR